jgi:hypothetical protein
MKLEKIKLILGIIISVVALVSVTLGVDNYFAKSKDITVLKGVDESLHHRIELKTIDDRIYQQYQQKIRIQDKIVMQMISREPTEAEKEAISGKEEAIKKLEKERDEMRKIYLEARKKK